MLLSLSKYRYYLSNDQIIDLNRTFNTYSNGKLLVKVHLIMVMLKSEGIYYDDKQLEQISDNLFKQHKKAFFNVYEFIAIVGRYYVDEETEIEFRKIFAFFDKKKKNKLNTQDLKQGVQQLGENVKDKDIDKMFLELDVDADGAIDFEEFMAAMISS